MSLKVFFLSALNLIFSLTAMSQEPRREQHPGGQLRGDGGHHVQPDHNHFDERGQYINHPGFREGIKYYRSEVRPDWARGVVFIPFTPIAGLQPGMYECVAFSAPDDPHYDYGPTENQAAFGALTSCGGADWEHSGCYIPEDYCRPI